MAISIHAPLAGCDVTGTCDWYWPVAISIHAPLAGCDRRRHGYQAREQNFNPRTPCGVRRVAVRRHAPRVSDFNPRTPCGVRLTCFCSISCGTLFQSTHPLRGATKKKQNRLLRKTFQSTHPLRGATKLGDVKVGFHCHFNPRTPCGVRRHRCHRLFSLRRFQSTHPLRGATNFSTYVELKLEISIHAPLAGCDRSRG